MLELDPAIEYACVPPDRLVFSGPSGSFTIVDKAGLINRFLDCLKHGLPTEQAFAEIEDPSDRIEVSGRVVEVLRARGVVREKSAENAGSEYGDILCAWLRFVGTNGQREPLVGVIGEGKLSRALERELASLGLMHRGIQHVDQACDLIVHCQDYEDMPALRAVNKQAVEANIPYLPVRLQRHVVSLGPMIIPGATACIECVYHRGQMNLDVKREDHPLRQQGATSEFTARFAAMLAGAEASRFLFGAIYDLHIATLKRYSVLTGKQAQSVALKLPRCPVCGLGRGERPLVDTFAIYDDLMVEPAE